MKYLKINEQIAIITSKIDNEICQSWEINKEDIIDAINFRNKLIKYLEDNIKIQKNRYEWYLDDFQKNKNEVVMGILKEIQLMIHIYQDILERIKSGKYD